MIKVRITKKNITIQGHAGYEEYGKDIVCASVSGIVTTTVNGILRLFPDGIFYRQDKDCFEIAIKEQEKTIDILLDNMVSLLEQLETQYPDYLKIIK